MTAALFGVLGLIVGFLAGVAFRDALDLYRVSRKERVMPTRNPTLNRWLLTLVLVVNGFIGGVLIYQRAAAEEFTRCTSQWQSDFYAAYVPRSQAFADTLAALDDVVSSTADRDQAKFDKALRNYQDVRRDQTADRKANPLPALPEESCGGPTR